MLPYIPARLTKTCKYIAVFIIFVCLLRNFGVIRRPDLAGPRYPPQQIPLYTCPNSESNSLSSPTSSFSPNDTALTESRILLLLESPYSRHGRLITHLLNSTKCTYKIDTFFKNLPLLTTTTHGRYSAIVIENFSKYTNLPHWNRQLLDKYSRDYKAPLLSFVAAKPNSFLRSKVHGSNLTYWQNQKAFNLRFSSTSSVPFVARPDAVLSVPSSEGKEWSLFEESPLFESILIAEDENGRRRSAVVRDKGLENGVEKILMGHNMSDWMIQLAFLDSIRWATKGRCGHSSLDRFIQIDIDDIFVGARGTRIVADDVEALIQGQDSLRRHISNFSFTLGFSGSYFLHGDDLEDEGDRKLIENADHFNWFPHMWKHNHAQDHNESTLEAAMILNKQFAESNGVSVPFQYAIAPKHAGVFPVYDALYKGWKKVWNISVSATEEYPHFKPVSERRGFVHGGIMVLPRQTCGLYTHSLRFHSYPGGLQKLQKSTRGGELFWTVILNPISVFMTHQQNYAHDRLALHTFEEMISFLKCWTRLNFKWEDPRSLALRYFQLFPKEKTPIWSDPCRDSRHVDILPPTINCSTLTLPTLLIVGPQKTGTTALLSFLQAHPDVKTSKPQPKYFEEVQFFSGENYEKGVEWYSNLFQNATVVVDKSATYFDHPEGAKRAAALVPDAKIVVILHDPIKRAYSWFHHLKARNDPSVDGHSMEDVLDGKTPAAKKVRQRCISGGRYAYHLDRWMEYFPIGQIRLVFGEELKDEPVKVLNSLSSFLSLPSFDFNEVILFNPKKGFFCRMIDDIPSCLGVSKGRHYPPISPSLSNRLCNLFRADNLALQKLLVKHSLPNPPWLPGALTHC